MTECPNCGFVFDEEERPKEKCPIYGNMVADKLSHLRMTHDIKDVADYQRAIKSKAASEQGGA